MFSIGFLPLERRLPKLDLTAVLEKWTSARSVNRLDPEEMPDALKRDLGLLDGRHPRGPEKGNPFPDSDLIFGRRNL